MLDNYQLENIACYQGEGIGYHWLATIDCLLAEEGEDWIATGYDTISVLHHVQKS